MYACFLKGFHFLIGLNAGIEQRKADSSALTGAIGNVQAQRCRKPQLLQAFFRSRLCGNVTGKAVIQHSRCHCRRLFGSLADSNTIQHYGNLHSCSLQQSAGHSGAYHLIIRIGKTAEAQQLQSLLVHQLLHQGSALFQSVSLLLRGYEQSHGLRTGFCSKHVHRPLGVHNFFGLSSLFDTAPYQ